MPFPSSSRRLLVTGGGGFIGRAVCRAASAAGFDVWALRRRPPVGSADCEGVRGVLADLTDAAAVRRALAEASPHLVVHAAGFASAERSPALVAPTLQNNLVGTVNLLSAALEQRVGRVVITGSVEAPAGVADLAEVTPSSPYAASKFAEAAYAKLFARQFGLDVVVARLAIVYGRGDKPTKLLPYLVHRLKQNEPAELSSGRRRADWLWIDDAAAGLLACATGAPLNGTALNGAAANGTASRAAAENGSGLHCLAGRTIDLGTGTLTSVADVARELAAVAGRPDLVHLGVRPDRAEETESAADVEATARLLGWRARVSLTEGLRRLYAVE